MKFAIYFNLTLFGVNTWPLTLARPRGAFAPKNRESVCDAIRDKGDPEGIQGDPEGTRGDQNDPLLWNPQESMGVHLLFRNFKWLSISLLFIHDFVESWGAFASTSLLSTTNYECTLKGFTLIIFAISSFQLKRLIRWRKRISYGHNFGTLLKT